MRGGLGSVRVLVRRLGSVRVLVRRFGSVRVRFRVSPRYIVKVVEEGLV